MSLDTIKHYPVMLEEVLSYLSDNKKIIDCTFGGGGYSSAILKKFPNSIITGIDRDNNVSKFADKLKKKYQKRFNFKNIRFSELYKLKEFKISDFFIFDLGVSHFQLKDLSRGFSFNSQRDLHMGMGLNTINAQDIINSISEKNLKNILKFFGEEKFASKIAHEIINYRNTKKINNSKELSDIINNIKYKKGKTNPATKSFQAIRMIVNEELSEVFKALKFIVENCQVNTTIIIVTFNSLEDLLVKKIINFYGKKKNVSRYLPSTNSSDDLAVKILTKKPLFPSTKEIKENPSSRSAKLRVIKKIKNQNITLQRNDLNMEKYFLLENIYV